MNNLIKQHIKKIICHEKEEFIPRMLVQNSEISVIHDTDWMNEEKSYDYLKEENHLKNPAVIRDFKNSQPTLKKREISLF